MSYELYRRSTLGLTLTDALDDMIQSEQMTPQLAMRVLSQFDKSMMECLESKVRSRGTYKASPAQPFIQYICTVCACTDV